MSNIESMYNFKVNIPQYEPTTPPKNGVRDCIDTTKAKELRKKIKCATNITEDEELFLIAATTRHYKFNYGKIADYYASASPEMQRLMEDSALVIIDIDDAIAKGYTSLNKKVKDIITQRVGVNNEG